MLTLRLQRVGRKHDPSYRIVATNSRTGVKSNKHVELLGQYDAIRKTTNIDTEGIKKHLANGATVSDTLRNILITNGVIEGKKVNPLSRKSPIVDEEAIAKAKEAEEKAIQDAADAKAKAEEEAQATESAEAAEEVTEEPATEEATLEATEEETPAEVTEDIADEAPTEEAAAEEEKA